MQSALLYRETWYWILIVPFISPTHLCTARPEQYMSGLLYGCGGALCSSAAFLGDYFLSDYFVFELTLVFVFSRRSKGNRTKALTGPPMTT